MPRVVNTTYSHESDSLPTTSAITKYEMVACGCDVLCKQTLLLAFSMGLRFSFCFIMCVSVIQISIRGKESAALLSSFYSLTSVCEILYEIKRGNELSGRRFLCFLGKSALQLHRQSSAGY